MSITRFGAALSTSFLASAMALGGAGVAQAQSLGSLTGSLESDPIELTVSGDTVSVGGTITNNAETDMTCLIGVIDAGVMRQYQALIESGNSPDAAATALADEFDEAGAAGTSASDDVFVAAGDTVAWNGEGRDYSPSEDAVLGAAAHCDVEGVADEQFAFAYESAGLLGSLDMGSLGS